MSLVLHTAIIVGGNKGETGVGDSSLRPVSRSFSSLAGGLHLTPLQDFVFIDGNLVSVQGTPVQDHGDGVHDNAVTANAISHVFINGIRISRNGEAATCGHLNTNGSNFVSAGNP